MLPHYTYEDYLHWEGKWELISGIPYAMSPAPVPKHQQISAALGVEIGKAMENCPQKCKLFHPIDYLIKEDTVLQPDLLIVCDKIEKKFLDFAPELVVEILSPSTAMKDRHTKFPIYERQGVKYFIIISPERDIVEIYELVNAEYDLQHKGHSIKHEFLIDNCKVAIDFSKIW